MSDHSRRDFIKYTGATATAGFLAGCGGGGGGGQGGGKITGALKFGMVPAESTDAPQVHLGSEYMEQEFGNSGEVTFLENNSLVTQALSAGQVHVGSGGFGGIAALAGQGRPVSMIGVHMTATDYVLVGQPGFETLEDAVNARIGIGSPTGLESLQTAGLFFQEGMIDSIDDLTYEQIGFSSARLQAMLQDDSPIDVTPLHYSQWLQLQKEGDYNLIAEFGGEFDAWIQDTWFTFDALIEDNTEKLANMLAAEIRLHEKINNDFDFYLDLIRRYVEGGGPPEENLRTTWEFLVEKEVWPTSLDVVTEDTVDFMLGVSNDIGITEEKIPASEVLNTSALELAKDKV